VSQTFFEIGRAAWPEVVVAPESLVQHLDRLREVDGRDAEDRQEHAADLYLAYACSVADTRALAAFDGHFITKVDAFVARVDSSPEFAAEVRQNLRTRLLVSDDGSPPRIARYSGQGPLGAWLRMAAMRVALDLKRARGCVLAADRVPEVADRANPEVQLLKKRYASEYQAALREAWSRLSVRERSVLRQHFVDGNSIDQVATVFQVHRATAARWINAAQEHLLDHVLSILGDRLRLPQSELQSIARLVQSELHLSLNHLADAP